MKTEAKRPRILTLDILRGFLLCVILVDHLGLFPSPYEFFTGRGLLWVSAAEGFFIISGLLVGYVYTPRMVRSARTATLKIWKRAALIYGGFVLMTLAMVLIGHILTPPMSGSGLWQGSTAGLLLQTLGLQYTYGWADFLRYYALFMLVAPLVLQLCIRGRAWVVVVAASLLWLVRGDSIWLAWQILFMGGIVIGYYLPDLQRRVRKLGKKRTRAMRNGVYAVAGVTIVASAMVERYAVFATQTYSGFASLPEWLRWVTVQLYGAHESLVPLVDKDSLAPIRLGLSVVWFTAVYLFIRHHEAVIDRWSRGSLRVIGENSLLVYIVEAFVIYLLLVFLAPDLPIVVNTLITTLALVFVYLVALFRSTARRQGGRTRAKLTFAGKLRRTLAVYSPLKQPRIITAMLSALTMLVCMTYLYSDRPDSPAGSMTAVRQRVEPQALAYNLGETVRDVPYCLGKSLDIYQPRHAVYQASPIVMYLHGGAWQLNDKASEPDQLAMIDGLRDQGYAVVSIDYSKTPEQYYPVAVQESLCAVRFLRAHAKQYGFDSSRVALYGFSAGGYLAAMVGVLPDHSAYMSDEYSGYSSRVHAVVTLAGLYSFTDALNYNNSVNIGRFLQETDPASAEVLQHFDAADPPFLLVHGVDDQYVQVAQDDVAEARMKSVGMHVRRLVVTHAEHGLNQTAEGMAPTRSEVARKIQQFIAERL